MAQLLAFALIVAVGLTALIVWRGRHYGRLAREGVKITATVERKFRTGAGGPGSRGRRIAFSYTGPDGQAYRRAATVTLSKWQELEEGYPIEIYVLPDRPGISGPVWLVDAAREALRKAGRL